MITPSVVHVDDLVYDYTQIADPNLRTLAQRAAEEIKPRLRRATEDILTIGNRLAVVREYLPHGQWMAWIETEFAMDYRTAHNFTLVAERFGGKSANFANLKPSALYALAAPSTPDDAIVEVEARIANGHTPTVAQTKTIIAEVRAGLVPAPAEPQASASAPPAKLLVDWTDDDWAAAASEPQASASAPSGRNRTDEMLRDIDDRLAQEAADTAVVRPSSVVSPPSDNIELSPEPTPAPANRLAVHYSSENAEHYTPDPIWHAAQKLMGSIDLDPCSNSHSQPNIPATRHYTAQDNGLRQYWTGNVYMNPPYGPAIGDWITKLVEAHTAGDVPQAIALIPARVDTKWWQLIRDYPVCFVTGRLTFKGNDSGAPFPSAIVYLGNNIYSFVREFSPIGDIWSRIQ